VSDLVASDLASVRILCESISTKKKDSDLSMLVGKPETISSGSTFDIGLIAYTAPEKYATGVHAPCPPDRDGTPRTRTTHRGD